MKSLFKYVALETFPICLGFSPAREGASSIVRNRVPSAETSPQSPDRQQSRTPGPEQREGSRGPRGDTSAARAASSEPLEPTGCAGSAPLSRHLTLSQPGHLRQAVLPSLYMMTIGCVTGKSAAKDPISYFSNTAQLKVYQLPGKHGFPSISVATLT